MNWGTIGENVVSNVLSYGVSSFISRLAGLLEDNANLLDVEPKVKDKVDKIHAGLEIINSFLEKYKWKRNSEIVGRLLQDIRDAAYEAEDEIDGYILKVAEHRKTYTKRSFHYPSFREAILTVEKKVEAIKVRIPEICSNKEWCLERNEATVNPFQDSTIQKFRTEVEEDHVVGFGVCSSQLVKQLTEGDPQLDVISIVGMGGQGKTTLARKVYNTLRVERRFAYYAWVCVSQDFGTTELLGKISKELGIEHEGKSVDELKKGLCESLKEKRYIIVMDDVWTTDVWKNVKSAFPDNSCRSRILITSRKREVARASSDKSPPYILQPLNEEDSWKLLSKMVFREGICPPKLVEDGKKIANGCKGLPLSIVVFAGILAGKEKSTSIWSYYVERVNSFLAHEEDTQICQKILSLSYMELPQRFKPCFLYFGMYPEDFEIPVKPLMHLWVAEGFMKDIKNVSPEVDAESYLRELIDRSLIQVASKRRDGTVRTCRIHDLLRELCMSESEEDEFLAVHSHNRKFPNKCQRLSIQLIQARNAKRYMTEYSEIPSRARSLFFFADNSDYGVSLKWVQKNFKFLRVLSFQKVATTEVRESVAKLIHLRYLTIRLSNNSKVLLDFIVELTNLETLYIESNGMVLRLPKGMFKLKRLRNLYLRGGTSLFEPCDSEEALCSLQVLTVPTIYYYPQNGWFPAILERFQNRRFPAMLEKFPNLRELKIEISEKKPCADGKVVSIPSLQHLESLKKLKIMGYRVQDPSGQRLFQSRFTCRPNSIPMSITKLTLLGVVLDVGCVRVLGELLHLQILKLEFPDRDLSDKSIQVIANSFPRLEFLKLDRWSIEKWQQGEGAMQHLAHLVIFDCDCFTSLPELLRLTSLRSVELKNCQYLATMMRESQMEFEFRPVVT